MTSFPTTRTGGLQWQCASAFSTSFRGRSIWNVESAVRSRAPMMRSTRWECSSFAAPPQLDSDSSLSCKTVKKKVAMWVGYVGTHYKGLQIQRSTADGQTIEQELEMAIFRAGGILESNFGSLEKLRWMRSSRTDKGVHSLSSVISFKLEVSPETWGSDEDGIKVADNINQYLPDAIRIFGIVPVNRSFEPRKACGSRTYHYLLPAAALGITSNSCAEEVQQCLDKFRNVLSSLTGRNPYHNYTMRSQYRKKQVVAREKVPTKDEAVQREEHLPPPELELSSDVESSEDDDFKATSFSSTSSCLTQGTTEVSLPPPKIRWLHEINMADKIFSAHFRSVFSFTCGELQTYKGLLFFELSVHGESFMLHQIRKMVGTAVAVMRGVLPSDIIPISLSCSCRAVLPLAPSEGLYLASNEFFPFRTSFRPKGSPKPENLPRLEMSARVLQRKEEFRQNVLLPHMVTLLEDNNAIWSNWLELLELGRICEAEMKTVREAWREWWLQIANRKAAEKARSADAGVDTVTLEETDECVVRG